MKWLACWCPDAAARTASLTENVQREAMHPADQFAAFAALVAEGKPVEDIAADFGVTPLVVERRLKLANVSPRLLADYRAGTATLEQLMALAVTDDHIAQEAAFYESPQWQRSAQALREHLTSREIDAARDPIARFVGIDAYRAAGGSERRDLFSDEVDGSYLSDATLLDRLAHDKLDAACATVRAEGWSWVEAVPRFSPADLHTFQRVPHDHRAPNKAEAKRIGKLKARQQEIEDRLNADDAEDIAEEEAQALCRESEELDGEYDAIGRSLRSYAAESLAIAGAVVTVDHCGALVVHRGLVRESEVKALRAQHPHTSERGEDLTGENRELSGRTLSEKLARQLSAHRTAALQAEVAAHPQVALVALAHRLALRVICDDYRAHDAVINVSPTPQDGLEAHASDLAQSPAFLYMHGLRRTWAGQLPAEPDALFAHLLQMPQQELLSLLAVCVATTVSAVTPRDDVQPAAALAAAVALDMHAWWTPTAQRYFAQVSKAKTIEAVEVFAPEQVARLSKLKKDALVGEAERLVEGTGWLPAMLSASALAAESVSST